MEVSRTLDDIYGQNSSMKERALMQARFMSDFFFFAEHVLGRVYSAFHHEEARYLFTHKFICIENPIGHGKTQMVSIDYPIWRMYREKGYEIAVTSSSMKQQAEKILFRTRNAIETNELLNSLIPSDSEWRSSKLFTKNGCQYYVTPFSDSSRGIHPNLLILDDILRAEDISQQDIKDIFWSVFYGRVQRKKGQIILVGTPQEVGDLFDEVEKKEGWIHLRYPAVITDDKGEWLRPLYPEVFTLDELRRIRDNMSEPRFQKEYLCNPIAGAASAIPTQVLMNSLYDSVNLNSCYEGVPYLGCDLASSTSRTADFSEFIGVDMITGIREFDVNINGVHVKKAVENPIVLRTIERYKGLSPNESGERIRFLSDSIKPDRCYVDMSQYGKMIVLELIAKGVNAEGVDFQSMLRRELLRNLIAVIVSGRLVIPYNNKDSGFHNIEVLISELSKLEEVSTKANYMTYGVKSGHDDGIMALAMAVKNVSLQRPATSVMFAKSKNVVIKPNVSF